MFDLNIRSYDENSLGETILVRFRCGCRMRAIGPGLVMRSCCRDHVPNESGDRVTLGALEDGPMLVECQFDLKPGDSWRYVDRGDWPIAIAMERATDPEWQNAARAGEAPDAGLDEQLEHTTWLLRLLRRLKGIPD